MTWRRLAVLVRKLRADSSSLTAAAYGVPSFTVDQYLLADLREAWGGAPNPFREDLGRKQRTSRARLLKARQAAWSKRRKG